MSKIIGIDLGTTNSCVARVGDSGHPENLPITQAIAASGVGEKSLLPSAIYLPAEGEFSEGGPQLPWPSADSTQILGLFANTHHMHDSRNPQRHEGTRRRS